MQQKANGFKSSIFCQQMQLNIVMVGKDYPPLELSVVIFANYDLHVPESCVLVNFHAIVHGKVNIRAFSPFCQPLRANPTLTCLWWYQIRGQAVGIVDQLER